MDEPARTVDSTDEALRRSAEVLRTMDQTLRTRRSLLDAADVSLGRANQLLREVDIDLAGIERAGAAYGTDPPEARVLVVDDNCAIRDLLRILFTVECGDDADVRCVDGGRAPSPASRARPTSPSSTG